jgi:hypothetical protein
LYALFHKPELFNKYFVGSPSIHYKNEVTFTYEREYANTHEDLEAHVFMTAGALEERTAQHVERMADTLYSRDYNGLQLETVIFPDENHITCAPAAVSRALIRLYQTGN